MKTRIKKRWLRVTSLRSRRRRRDVVVLGFRIEELAGGRDRFGGGVLIFLAGRDVLAALDTLGFISAARDRHGDAGLDFGMDRNRHLLLADRLDRRIQPNLRPVDDDAVGCECVDDVAHRDRAEQLTGFGRLADDLMSLPSIFSATLLASPLAWRLLASSSAFMPSNLARLSAVARSALPRLSRKLRAKPSRTLTTSPIWPSLATRSSKMTSMLVLLRMIGRVEWWVKFQAVGNGGGRVRIKRSRKSEHGVGKAEHDHARQRPGKRMITA